MGDAWNAPADPTRRKIWELLSKGDLSAGEISDNFKISKPSVSHHLNILKNAELVYCEKRAKYHLLNQHYGDSRFDMCLRKICK